MMERVVLAVLLQVCWMVVVGGALTRPGIVPEGGRGGPSPPPQDLMVVVGDMLVPQELYDQVTAPATSRKGIIYKYLWPRENGIPTIPYFISVGANKFTREIEAGMNHWETHTCLKFKKTTGSDAHSIMYVSKGGCWSYVGMIDFPTQAVSIGNGCQSLRTVVHEVGHAIGLFHEQARPDRDRYVVIHDNNIQDGQHRQFAIMSSDLVNDQGVAYDYTSVMHYGGLDFTKNGLPTLSTKDPKYQGLLSRRQELSHRDKHIVNLMYGCVDMWMKACDLPETHCFGEGYLGKDCTCVCPPGTSGQRCEITQGEYYGDMMPACSQVITEERTFSSPAYPRNIPEGTWCVYTVEAPVDHVVEVTFLSFEMILNKPSGVYKCYADYLQVRDHDMYNGNVFCGRGIKTNQSFVSTSRTMYVYLHTTTSYSKGFKAEVKFYLASDAPDPSPGAAVNVSGFTCLVVTCLLVHLLVEVHSVSDIVVG
ncbi:blastula protease 10-like [Homarus americanus]|uniref:blastula protease 10-like n=1 Tax=Homarus americanus TaxID=6706 RepID=UPI001C46A3A7|nr:blastula protease 10-like [Homarus americanus]XP_042211066.1 blastula protease 10-like [Homarus americanus]